MLRYLHCSVDIKHLFKDVTKFFCFSYDTFKNLLLKNRGN